MDKLFQLVFVFFKIGLFSIGGGYAIIPLIQEEVVEQLGWVSGRTFTDIITISQMTPGPLAVNTSTFIGIRICGPAGAVAATFGCVVSGIAISCALYCIFRRYQKSDYVLEMLNGLKSCSLGLIISAAITILHLSFAGTGAVSDKNDVDWTAVFIFAGAFLLLRKWKLNPVLIMALCGFAGCFYLL